MTEKNRLRGKKSRASGQRFELKVRADAELNGWIVAKWTNNVKLPLGNIVKPNSGMPPIIVKGGLIPVKNKFRGIGIPMMLGAGFPDFVAFRKTTCWNCQAHGFGECSYEVIGIEVKSNGYLDKEEKLKCKWLLENNIFSRILIAKKGKKRGSIEYVEFNTEAASKENK